MCKKRMLNCCVLILCIFIFSDWMPCWCNSNNFTNKKILIIGSYTSDSKWEQSIINGFSEANNDEYSIKVEFLDSKFLETEEYDESFINLLNLKYENSNIDYIITLDDEAFELVRKNLFNENLFAYKKNIIFIGVNDYVELSEEERLYIKGILEYQDNLSMIDTMLNAGKKVTDIYLLLDKSTYSKTVEEDFSKLIDISNRCFNYHIIEGVYFDDIKDECSKIDYKNSAIYLCGTYKDINDNGAMSSDDVMYNIKQLTDAPIYTKLEEYIYSGAVGGIVNDGYKLGKVAYMLFKNIVSESYLYNIVPAYDTFSIPIFNYESMSEYGINPFKLPEHSIFINRKPYDFLLPKYLIIIVWILVIIALIGIVLLIYLFLINRKKARKNKLLLVESMEREKIKTDFIVTISHELRTPLNIIINATNLLKLRLDNKNIEPSFFYEKLDYIMKNSNRLRRYINNLIDVSKLEIGYINAEFSNENIVNVIEDVTLTIVDLAKRFNLEVIFDTEEEEIITAIDKVKIERVILNILSNAIKFTKDGGVIMVLVKREATNVVIEISDNGIGMSEETQNHVFEKFKRADINEGLNRQNEGSGLGLFIVRGLIELHGGDIILKSKLNEGSIFVITLPIRIVKEDKKDNLMGDSSLEYMFEMELSDIDKKE